jgi:hypothetical protein
MLGFDRNIIPQPVYAGAEQLQTANGRPKVVMEIHLRWSQVRDVMGAFSFK